MNPVDLIRELAEALDTWTTGLPAAHRDRELLRRAQTFLAAQPVVVELTERYTSGDGLLFLAGLETGLPDDTAYDVHVIVTPGAR